MIKFSLFGIIQGLTEFLPISSSGHLYIINNLFKRFGESMTNLLPFFVLLHLATLLSIVLILRKEIVRSLTNKRLIIHLGIITIITACLGLFIEKLLSPLFESKWLISACLLINAGILLTIKNVSGTKTTSQLQPKDCIFLGILQGLAMFPGISRSGITITGALKCGIKREETFTLSFLMAIPTILGAFILEAPHLADQTISSKGMLLGCMAAFICGVIALCIVKKALLNRRFHTFSYYCAAVALLSLLT